MYVDQISYLHSDVLSSFNFGECFLVVSFEIFKFKYTFLFGPNWGVLLQKAPIRRFAKNNWNHLLEMPKPIFTQILSQTNTTAVNLCNNTCFCAISIKWVESCTILSAAALHAGESSKWIPLQTLKLQMHHIVHVCSQRVWECKSRNAVTLKQPPLDTVATIQLSLWWEDENKEKSDDKYKLRARLCSLSSFKLILRIVCLFVQYVCFLAIQIRLMAWLGFDLAGSVVYRGGRDRLLGLLASWACHKRSQVAMVVVEPD